MEIVFKGLSLIYVIFVGIIITCLDIPFIYQTLFIMVSMLLYAMSCVHLLEERLRLKNHIRFCVSIYFPISIFAMVLFLANFFSFSILLVFILSFLVSCMFLLFFRKQYYVPYFLLVSNMNYKKAKEESKRMVKMNKTESFIVFLIYIELLMVSSVLLYTCMQMDFYAINLWMLLPVLLMGSYFSSCMHVHIYNNEHSHGKFSFKALCLLILIVCIISLSFEGLYGIRKMKSSLCKENEVDGHTYEVALLKMDYKTQYVSAKKGDIEDEDLSFLIKTTLPALPIDYEVYYASEIEDPTSKDSVPAGLTLFRKNKVQSYISKGTEVPLEHVFYHEYAHVLFQYMEDYKELAQSYEKLRSAKYNEENFYDYYASPYSLSSILEDMCEEYAMYMWDESFRENLSKKPIHKKKCDLIREYLLREYDYDMYGEDVSQPIV